MSMVFAANRVAVEVARLESRRRCGAGERTDASEVVKQSSSEVPLPHSHSDRRHPVSAGELLKDARTVAVGCDQLPKSFHGKQGVCRGLPPIAGGPLATSFATVQSARVPLRATTRAPSGRKEPAPSCLGECFEL
jgi:hypothetical protein